MTLQVGRADSSEPTLRILITGGGTVAPIDEVRRIVNRSTGRFAAALVEAWLMRGARVWHLRTSEALRPFRRDARFDLEAETTDTEVARLLELRHRYRAVRDRLVDLPLHRDTVGEYQAALERVFREETIDLAMLAMAVSDYEPDPVSGKIRSDRARLRIDCQRTPKVIAQVKDWSPRTYLVGFKLLSGVDEATLERVAREALVSQRADATIANDDRTVREGRHKVLLIRPDADVEPFGPEPERPLAAPLVARLEEILRGSSTSLNGTTLAEDR